MKPRRLLLLVLLLLFGGAAFAPVTAHARPGGGHAFSGGGSRGYSGGGFSGGSRGYSGGHYSGGGYSSGGSSEGDGVAIVFFLAVLAIMTLVIFTRARAASDDPNAAFDSGHFHEARPPVPVAGRSFAELREDDPDFSAVLFDDFVYSLYARAHRARHDAAELARLAPYLAEVVRGRLAGLAGSGPISAVIVGSASVLRVRRKDGYDWVRVAFEANLLGAATEYVREEWVYRRSIHARTRPWKGARTFNCPNCAAPATRFAESKCEYCGEIVDGGRFDWEVFGIDVAASEARPPALTGTVAEVGTDDPTIFDAAAQRDWAALRADDPALTPETFGARLALLYAELNRGWNASEARLVRPWVSDGLFAYLEY